MKEVTEDNFDMLDGYDELPEDLQVTVRRAFEQGHVDDADWRGVGLSLWRIRYIVTVDTT